MDSRQEEPLKNNQGNGLNQLEQLDENSLNDALIFNIIKKIQLRQKMQGLYSKEKQQSNQTFLTKYVFHSWTPLYYIAAIFAIKFVKAVYLNTAPQRNYKFANLLLHGCVALSINQYDRYHQVFRYSSQLGNQYQQYRQNLENLMKIKEQRLSLSQRIIKSQYFQAERVFSALKYRLIL